MNEPKLMTVGEIVTDIQAAVQRMGVNNPHRALLMRCGNALISLAQRVPPLEPTEIVQIEEPATV